MLERILLAAIATFCIYLFLNLGEKSSNMPVFSTQSYVVPIINRVKSWNW